MLREFWAVACKEWRDALRDRRAVFAALAYAVFGPVVLAAVLNAMAREESTQPQRVVQVSNAGAAPALVAHLRADGFRLADRAPVVLAVPEDFSARLATGRPATVTATLDVASHERELEALRSAIAGFSETVAGQRLLARGVAPVAVRPLRVSVADTARLSARGEAVMSMLVLFLILAPFFASTSVAIDATSGERERGSLEALMALPSMSASTIVGKWLVTAGFALLGTVLTVAVGALAVNRAPLADIGVRLYIDGADAALAIAVLAPLALLVAAAQLLIALAARSFKEGQTYLTLFAFVPVFVGLVAMRSSVAELPAIPVLTEMHLLNDALANGRVDAGSLATTTLVYAAVAALALWAATARIQHETMLADG